MPAAAPEKEVAVAAHQAWEGAYIYVLILLCRCVYVCPHSLCKEANRCVYVSLNYYIGAYICVLILVLMYPSPYLLQAPEKEDAVAADQVGEGTEVHAGTLEEQLIKTNLW
jgi:hypothetical protein